MKIKVQNAKWHIKIQKSKVKNGDKMVEFQRTIGKNEENSSYLNLSDNSGNSYGYKFPEGGTPLWIVTEDRRYKTTKHHGNQIWGNLKSWYKKEGIHAGDIIQIKYDPVSGKVDGRVPVEISIIQRAGTTPEVIA